MSLRRLLAVAALLATAAGCVESADIGANDELVDFSTTELVSDAPPYESYVRAAEQNGVGYLDFREAEELSVRLCTDPAALDNDPSRWSPTDTLIVRAYCPERELGG